MLIFIGLAFLMIGFGGANAKEDTPYEVYEGRFTEAIASETGKNINFDFPEPPEVYEVPPVVEFQVEVPFYFQRNEKWKDLEYGKGTVGGSGCVPTSLAMVLSFKGHDVCPQEMARFSVDGGHVASPPDYGTKFSLFSAVAKNKGLDSEKVEEVEEIFEHLREGRPVVVVGRGNPYNSGDTSYGHAMVLTGFRKGLVFYVNDPAHPSKETVAIKEILENPPSFAKVLY